MLLRAFGQTGLQTPALALGAGSLGGPDLEDAEVDAVLHGAIDLGLSLIDTAPSYGEAEARIGRLLRRPRETYLLSTKGGYGVPGVPDWTGDAIRQGVRLALKRLQTDHLDLFFLHSCPLEVLRRDDVLRAVEDVVDEGLVRVAGYSGENEALAFALSHPAFGAVQTSVSVVDQHSMNAVLPVNTRCGVLAKRALGNAFWRHTRCPDAPDVATYWRRGQALDLTPALPWPELMVRFTAFAPGVHTCLVGSRRLANLKAAVEALERGPLPADVLAIIQSRFLARGRDWQGVI
ncbi:MAG: aldo/keto reductase [Bradymonadia bacterium]